MGSAGHSERETSALKTRKGLAGIEILEMLIGETQTLRDPM